jgi:serine/threonine protein kinase
VSEPQLLGGRYELHSPIGHGGMAEVFCGADVRLGRDVAVKVLRADLARDPAFQNRFRREAQAAASLNAPSIVSVFDTGEDEAGVPYIVMEYVEGKTLRDLLLEEGRLLPERALEITADVCAALEVAHAAGIVHRDIKPANVMVNGMGEVKVMDFGIARAMSDASSAMTQTAAVIGTAAYLSPEQARGEHVDLRSDLYSTGCLLYELVTGGPPFTGDSAVAVAYQHVREDPVPPSAYDETLSPEVDAVIL